MTRTPNGQARSLRIVGIPGKGRGVVAGRRLCRGEVVGSAPVIVIPSREWPLVEQTVLSRYCFVWDDVTGSVAVALGRCSLLNHSYVPNVTAERKVRSRLMVFSALRDVEPGEELTLNYNGPADCRDPVGFEVRDP